jgi:hypothetical protein
MNYERVSHKKVSGSLRHIRLVEGFRRRKLVVIKLWCNLLTRGAFTTGQFFITNGTNGQMAPILSKLTETHLGHSNICVIRDKSLDGQHKVSGSKGVR